MEVAVAVNLYQTLIVKLDAPQWPLVAVFSPDCVVEVARLPDVHAAFAVSKVALVQLSLAGTIIIIPDVLVTGMFAGTTSLSPVPVRVENGASPIG